MTILHLPYKTFDSDFESSFSSFLQAASDRATKTEKKIKSVNVQIMKLASFTAIKSEIKVSIEIKALLYNGLIANSDQSIDYYKILSRVVR